MKYITNSRLFAILQYKFMTGLFTFFFVGVLFALSASIALAAPGGVSSGLDLWLKADQNTYNTGTTQATDGQTVETWDDLSGNNRDATTLAKDPTFLDGDNAGALNFNPVVDFNGAEALDLQEFPTPGSVQAFAAVKGNGGNGMVFGTARFGSDYWLLIQESTSGQDTFQVGDSGNGTVSNFKIGYDENGRILEVKEFAGTASARTNAGTFSTNGSASSANAVNQMSLGSRTNGTSTFYNGEIAELIFYNTEKTGTDAAKIHSYLSIKYGTPLDQSTAQDYINSAGTVMWDATTDTTYNNDVFGIARDDTSALGQVKSRTINDDGILTLTAESEGTNYVNSFVDMADGESLLVGNNGFGATWETCGANAPALYQVLSRKWKVEEAGDVGTVQLDFDVADADFNVATLVTGSDYFFIHDTNGNSDLSDETPIAMTDQGGDIWRASGINLADNALFTIATQSTTTIQFSGTTASDVEDTGGNLPTLFVCGTVGSASTVTVTDTGTGTATSGVDYTPAQATAITVPTGSYDGTSTTEVVIPSLAITTDAGLESDETIIMTLGSATGDLTLGTNTSHTYTITNDDVADVTAPTIAEVTPVTMPTGDSTPDVTFSSDEAGTITYGGSCNSTTTAAVSGNNTVTLDSDGAGGVLADGAYSNCTITVTDASSNVSSVLTFTAFTVDTSIPTVAFTRGGGAAQDVKDATGLTLTFRATFSEDVTNVDTSDFEVLAGGATGTISSVTSVSASEYDIVVSSIALAGTLDLQMGIAGAQDIVDTLAVAFTGTITATEKYILDDAGASTTAIEDAGYNGGDANGDGTADKLQKLVATINDTVTSGTSTLEASGGSCSVIDTFTISAEDALSSDSDNVYPIGLYNYNLECGVGDTASITIYLDELRTDTADWVFRKYTGSSYVNVDSLTPDVALNLVVDDYTFTTGPNTGSTVTRITYQLKDGDVYDQDGDEDGMILDPIGPAVPDTSNSGSGGGWGGNRVSKTVEKYTIDNNVTVEEVQACVPYLTDSIKRFADNDTAAVTKLEQFLNEFEGENLIVNGVYEEFDELAVKRFQRKYAADILAPWGLSSGTGFVHTTTIAKINEIQCGDEDVEEVMHACPADQILSQPLRSGARDTVFDAYTGETVREVAMLQAHINRILGEQYAKAAGPVDGWFGDMTEQGVERLQRHLNTTLAPTPALDIDGIVGPFTRSAINNSCTSF